MTSATWPPAPFIHVFLAFSIKLPTFRSLLIDLAGVAVAVSLGVPSLAAAQDYPASPGAASDAAPIRADVASAASAGDTAEAAGVAAVSTEGFAERQAVLDHRSEENNYRYALAQHNCYSRFFVNYCLNKARAAMRVVQADVRKEQLALDDEQRVARATQRDEQTALKRAQNEKEAPQRAADAARNAQAFEDKQRQHALDEAQRNAEAPQRAANEQAFQEKQRQHALDQAQRGISAPLSEANQKAYDQKQTDFQRKLDAARREGAQKAQERVQNEQRFQKKQVDAARHKADVEARQKQAAEKAQQKQQEQQQQQMQ